jgi:hypothetical protein
MLVGKEVRQEDCKFKANLCYIERPCFKKEQNKEQHTQVDINNGEVVP